MIKNNCLHELCNKLCKFEDDSYIKDLCWHKIDALLSYANIGLIDKSRNRSLSCETLHFIAMERAWIRALRHEHANRMLKSPDNWCEKTSFGTHKIYCNCEEVSSEPCCKPGDNKGD
jgi:hypothetical protein